MKKTKTLDRLIETIVEDASPEKIFLISYYEREENYSNLLRNVTQETKKVATYDLLVLIDQNRDLEGLSEFLETRTSIIADTTILAYPIDSINKLIEYGHPYLLGLIEQDCLIYDANSIDLENFASIDTTVDPYPGKRKYSRALAIAEEFLAAANLHMVRKDNVMAAYNLQQCAVQLFVTALLKGTGIWFVSEDITRLQRYNYWHSADMMKIMQTDEESGSHICRSLQKANFNSRYNHCYQVFDGELYTLQTEVRKLFDLTIKILKDPSTI